MKVFQNAKMHPSQNIRKRTITQLIIIAALIQITAQPLALSVGTAPGVLDLGEVNPGENVEFKFYLVSNTETDMLVDLSPIRPHTTLFESNQTGRYTFIPSMASNMMIENWVRIKRSPVLVSPSRTQIVKLKDGGTIRANGEGDVVLQVPRDAEPCYFISSINPSPLINPISVDGGTGVSTIGITRFVFVFKVAGEGRRSGDIVDIIPFRQTKNLARFDVLFKNTGTCTVMAWVSSLKIYGENGSVIADTISGSNLIPPGKIGALQANWNSNNIPEGNYRAEATVEYYTGSEFYEKTVTILRPPPTPIGGAGGPGAAECYFPWWILLALLALALMLHISNRATDRNMKVIFALAVLVTVVGAIRCFSSIPWTWFLLTVIVILLRAYLKD